MTDHATGPVDLTQEQKIRALADLLLTQQRARLAANFSQEQADHETTRVVHGKVYAKVDVGSYGSYSARLMVEYVTGVVYGTKSYGQVHKGHAYGTLDTIDQWYWGDYYPRPAEAPVRPQPVPMADDVREMLERAEAAIADVSDAEDAEHDSLEELVEYVKTLHRMS